MYKLLIADDEPKARKSLFETLKWDEFNITVVGLARNGKEALEMAKKEKPDIGLIDICMPHMNGLELIEKLNDENPDMLNIIVSGHDEFEYAQKAVKLKVFDYILKPVYDKDLRNIIHKAAKELEENLTSKKNNEWTHEQLKKNISLLKDKFILNWINGELTREETDKQLEFHGIKLGESVGFILLKLQKASFNYGPFKEGNNHQLFSEIHETVSRLLQAVGDYHMVKDDQQNFVAVLNIKNIEKWDELKVVTENEVEKQFGQIAVLYQVLIDSGIKEIPHAYQKLKKEILNESLCLPVIRKVKLYIERNFGNPGLSLQMIAEDLQISASYLSTLFKQEMGISFSDYLTKVRIMEAVKLMNNPATKIYEIAERIGYSSQHYFCNAFKKVLGVSPTEYKRKNI